MSFKYHEQQEKWTMVLVSRLELMIGSLMFLMAFGSNPLRASDNPRSSIDCASLSRYPEVNFSTNSGYATFSFFSPKSTAIHSLWQLEQVRLYATPYLEQSKVNSPEIVSALKALDMVSGNTDLNWGLKTSIDVPTSQVRIEIILPNLDETYLQSLNSKTHPVFPDHRGAGRVPFPWFKVDRKYGKTPPVMIQKIWITSPTWTLQLNDGPSRRSFKTTIFIRWRKFGETQSHLEEVTAQCSS